MRQFSVSTTFRLFLLISGTFLAGCKEEVAAVMSEQAELGHQVFEERCAACHQLETATHSQTAPSLKGIIGRAAGKGGFNYSDAFQSADFEWTSENMLEFLEKPRDVVPDNMMAFYGLENRNDRVNLVEYLLFHSE